jgi:hypothetical protein
MKAQPEEVWTRLPKSRPGQAIWGQQTTTNGELKKAVKRLAPLAETSRDLVKQTELLYKSGCRLIETGENESAVGRPHRTPVEGRLTLYTEGTFVLQTTPEYLEQELGWESVSAYNNEHFGPGSLRGRESGREVVLTRTPRAKLEELNPGLPAAAYEDPVRQIVTVCPCRP